MSLLLGCVRSKVLISRPCDFFISPNTFLLFHYFLIRLTHELYLQFHKSKRKRVVISGKNRKQYIFRKALPRRRGEETVGDHRSTRGQEGGLIHRFCAKGATLSLSAVVWLLLHLLDDIFIDGRVQRCL